MFKQVEIMQKRNGTIFQILLKVYVFSQRKGRNFSEKNSPIPVQGWGLDSLGSQNAAAESQSNLNKPWNNLNVISNLVCWCRDPRNHSTVGPSYVSFKSIKLIHWYIKNWLVYLVRAKLSQSNNGTKNIPHWKLLLQAK